MTAVLGIDLRRYLPAVYPAAQRAGSGDWDRHDPVDVLLNVLGQTCDDIDGLIVRVPSHFDGRSAPYADDRPARDFLGMLSAWTGLELDDLLPREEKTETPTPAVGRRESTLRQLVMNAAALHRTRGTRIGLELAIGLLFEVKPQVVEWAWPSGLQVGVHAALGRDSLLTGGARLDEQTVIVWNTPAVDVALAGVAAVPDDAGESPWSEIVVPGDDGAISGLQLLSRAAEPASPQLAPLIAELGRLRRLLLRELPATVDVFIIFASPSRQQERDIKPFMVEIDAADADQFSSTVGFARLEASVTDHV